MATDPHGGMTAPEYARLVARRGRQTWSIADVARLVARIRRLQLGATA